MDSLTYHSTGEPPWLPVFRLLETLRKACRIKPVVILKSGRTPLGRQATLSHTGSLSGEDLFYDAAFRQAGALRAYSLSEMIEMARVLSSQPPMKGKKVGILTTSGSLGAMTADALYLEGMELARWSEETIAAVRGRAPAWVNVKNPLDVGPSGIFPSALEAIFSDPDADGFILIPVIPYAAIENLIPLGFSARVGLGDWPVCREKVSNKPVIAVLLGSVQWLEQIKGLCGNTIATVPTPEAAAKALSALFRLAASRNPDNLGGP